MRERLNYSVTALSLLFIISGLAVISVALVGQRSVPSVTASGTQRTETSIKESIKTRVEPLNYSLPVSVSIPSLNISSDLLVLGKDADGRVAVPEGDDYNKAAWYKHSPSPGQVGASIIEGHVDYIGKGPAIFYELATISLGATIEVQRSDGSTAVFTVTEVDQYEKDSFPTHKVYFDDSAALRLVTCGGAFNKASGEYDSNVVVFARLSNVK